MADDLFSELVLQRIGTTGMQAHPCPVRGGKTGGTHADIISCTKSTPIVSATFAAASVLPRSKTRRVNSCMPKKKHVKGPDT